MRIICILVAILFLAAVPAKAEPHWHGGGWGWHGWQHNDDNNGFVGGIIGGAIGSAIGNIFAPPVVVAPPVVLAPTAPPVTAEIQPWTPAWYTYCAQRYRSFNSQTGYYTGFDGRPYFCQ